MDLNEPLGITPRRRRLSGLAVLGILAGVASCAALGGAAFILLRADPHGGEPYAVASVAEAPPPAPARPVAASGSDPMTTGSLPDPAKRTAPNGPAELSRTASAAFDAPTIEGGVKVFRGGGQGVPGAASDARSAPLVIDVSRALDDPFDRRRGKVGATGLASTGLASTSLDAKGLDPKGAAPAARAIPRVAIFVSGMGLDRAATRTATETMPPAVTLAFVPYGDSVRAAADAAKARGHEILLQIPMQNAGGMAPGPHALKPGEAPAAVKADMAWLMDRIAGYDGVANLLGAPVTADAGVVGALVDEADARHLFVLDDGTSRESRMPTLAAERRVAAVKADLVIDATSDPAAVRNNLDRLVALARSKGSAVGMATGLPDHMGAIARFAAGLEAQGVTLVPVAQLARRGDDVAAMGH